MTLEGVGYAAALVLCVVFVVAAAAKLRDLDGVARDFDEMAIRSPALAARILPAVELVTAVVLTLVPWLGGSLAAAILVGFTVVLWRQVRSGAVAHCACFGAASSQTVSSVDLVRNGALIVAALVAVAARRMVPSLGDVVVVGLVASATGAALRWLRTAADRRESE